MQKQDAVIIRRIEIIAEATAHLTEETRHSFSQLSFGQMRGMRNIVAHDYGNVDPKTIGEVATIHVPNVCSVLENFFAGQKGPATRAMARRLDAGVRVR